MNHEKTDNRVLLRYCEAYDQEKIQQIVTSGMQELNYQPKGNIFVKPNVVYASKNGKYGSTAYTDPAIVGGALLALSCEPGVNRVDMGEKTAIGYPTRLSYKYAGYYKQLRKIRDKTKAPVKMFCIEEDRRDRVFVGGI
jgi:hypothetical protein